MGEVKAYRRIHYSGLDADKASVTGAAGETYAGNDSGKLYYWNDALAAWKTGLGYETMPIEKAVFDWTEANFTLDGTVKPDGLDLTGKVPVGATIVGFVMNIKHASAGKSFMLNANQTTKIVNKFGLTTQVANQWFGYVYGRIYIDANRLLDYTGDADLNIFLAVVDWDI